MNDYKDLDATHKIVAARYHTSAGTVTATINGSLTDQDDNEHQV